METQDNGFYIKCRKCGDVNVMAKKPEEMYKTTHHLECNWCPACEDDAGDYWEEFQCDKDGNEIDE